MAVSGVSRSTSIYGNRNVITGLASGMDTESMIENAISAYKNKITALQQKRTKTEWKQESYRSIIEKMSSFTEKYTSYRSANNLMSTSFFNQAVKTVAKGKYADKVSATGRASSDVQIDRVQQLARAATYTLSGSVLDGTTSLFGDGSSVTASASGLLDLDKEMEVGVLNGNLTLSYGGKNDTTYLTVSFDETKSFKNTQELVDEINKQLGEQSVSIGTSTYTGKELLDRVVKAEVGSDGKITFTDPKKNNVYVSGATGNLKANLLGGKDTSTESGSQIKSLTVSDSALNSRKLSGYQYLMEFGGSMEITLDGKSKSVKLPGAADIISQVSSSFPNADALKTKLKSGEALTDEAEQKERDRAFLAAFQDKIDEAFGEGKLTVSSGEKKADEKGIRFQFETTQTGSTFSIESSKGEVLGLGESKKITSYLNTGKTLGDLLKGEDFDQFEQAFVEKKDAAGNTIKEAAKDANGKYLYSFKVNGKEIGQFNEDSTLNDVINAMNSNTDSGVKVGFSKLTNNLTFTAKDTGANSEITFDGPSAKLFKTKDASEADQGKFAAGQDAIFEATVNGTTLKMTRSSNSIDLDGMTVTLKGTFGYETDEAGDVKYNYSQKEENGRLLFEEMNGVSVYGKKDTAGRIQLENAKGGALRYTSPSNKDLDGANIYAEVADDGSVKFFAQKEGGEKTPVYAQKGETGKGVWFSVNEKYNGQDALTGRAQMNAEPTPVKGTEAVTFETSSDADKIVDVVKQMVEDYNAMAREIKSAYSTLPAYRNQSKNQLYEPLTEEDEEGMSETAIKNWTEKAKQGILFGDRDLANLYQRMTSAISLTGENGAALRSAGITVNYANGLSTLEFNETQFRAALDKDPDAVRNAFTASTEAGAKSDGLMQALKQPLDAYGKTSGGKGALVEKAGSPLAPSTMYSNTIQKELTRIDTQIEKWQDKMSSQVDRYTQQFSRLEQLIQQMNSQSSYFSQLMGG